MPSGTSLCLQEAQIRLETKDTSRNKTKKKRLETEETSRNTRNV